MKSLRIVMQPEAPRAGCYIWYVCLVLCLANVLSSVDRNVMSVAIVPLKSSLQLSDTQLGMLAGLGFALLFCSAGLAVGWIADVTSRRNILMGGVVIWTVATASCALAQSFETLFLCRILVGFGEATIIPAGLSLLSSYFKDGNLGKAVGIFTAGIPIGKAVAFIGGGALLSYFALSGGLHLLSRHFEPWQILFLAAAAPGLLVAVLFLTVREPPHEKTSRQMRGRTLWNHVRQHRRAFLLHTSSWTCLILLQNVIAVWSPSLFVRQYGMDIAHAAGLVGTVALIVGGVGTVAGGTIMDWLQRRGVSGAAGLVMTVALVSSLPAAALFTLGGTALRSACGYGCLTMMISAGGAAGLAAIPAMTPVLHRGLMTSILYAIASLISLGIGPLVIGGLSDHVFAALAQGALGASIITTFMVFVALATPAAIGSRPGVQSAALASRTAHART